MNYYFGLLLFSLSFSFSSNAQNSSFGIEAGAALSFKPQMEYDFLDPGIGISVNGAFQYEFERFHLKTTAGFEQKSYVLTFELTDEVGNNLGTNRTTYVNDYIVLSQLIGISYGDSLYGFTNIGISGSRYLITRENYEGVIIDGTNYPAWENKINIGTSYDVSALIESGVGLTLGEKSKIYLVASYSHGFIAQWETNDPTSLAPWKNKTVALKLGFQRTF